MNPVPQDGPVGHEAADLTHAFLNRVPHANGAPLLQFIIDALPHEFWVMDAQRNYIVQNEQSLTSWGDLRGHSIEAVEAPAADVKKWRENDARVLDGQHVVGCYERHIGGHCLRYVDALSPLISNNEVTGIVGLNINIDSPWPGRNSGESDLKEATREIAHHLNNKLAVILGSAYLAGTEQLDPTASARMQTIQEAAEQATDYTLQLRKHIKAQDATDSDDRWFGDSSNS
ncbi:MAG: hypothetical protein AAF581_16005 [Planctomycetota bacterium]